MTTALTLDTDIGSDVDDVLALATIFGSPELDLTAVTTVYGDTLLRARMVARVSTVAGRESGPIVPGRTGTRSGREVWWAGHEGALLPDLERERVDTGADPIALLATSPTVVAVGPLTTVAEAVEQSGRAVEQLHPMGGDFSLTKTEAPSVEALHGELLRQWGSSEVWRLSFGLRSVIVKRGTDAQSGEGAAYERFVVPLGLPAPARISATDDVLVLADVGRVTLEQEPSADGFLAAADVRPGPGRLPPPPHGQPDERPLQRGQPNPNHG